MNASAMAPSRERCVVTLDRQSAPRVVHYGEGFPREKLPEGNFPEAESHVHTHHADAVERRMFESLGNGEDLVRGVAHRIPEEPRFAFAAGLISLVVILALLASHAGGAP